LKVKYESRLELDVLNSMIESLNICEKERFMEGAKEVVLVTEAAGSGISLQAIWIINYHIQLS
jgi:hypothetical protein